MYQSAYLFGRAKYSLRKAVREMLLLGAVAALLLCVFVSSQSDYAISFYIFTGFVLAPAIWFLQRFIRFVIG
jgi:hypothetical protein